MADREDEPIEIVKRIETPHTENEESGKKEEIVHVNENIYVNDSVSTDEEYRKKEKKSSSNMTFWLVNQDVFSTDFYFVK